MFVGRPRHGHEWNVVSSVTLSSPVGIAILDESIRFYRFQRISPFPMIGKVRPMDGKSAARNSCQIDSLTGSIPLPWLWILCPPASFRNESTRLTSQVVNQHVEECGDWRDESGVLGLTDQVHDFYAGLLAFSAVACLVLPAWALRRSNQLCHPIIRVFLAEKHHEVERPITLLR